LHPTQENIVIQSKDDYLFYLKADQIGLGIELKRPRLFQDEVWKFQRYLRKVEYLENCRKDPLSKLRCLYARYNLEKLSIKLGFVIPRNIFGPGLSIAHRGSIVIHHGVRAGENCRIFHGVTIGTDLINDGVPFLGKNVIVGTGAVIVGPISIADGITIGANSFVNKTFDEPNISIGGYPARKISNKGSEGRWIRATEIMKQMGKKS
jgi:serine O-acetyltransferase